MVILEKNKNSLVFKLTIGSAIVVLTLFAAMIINYIYSIYIVQNNIVISKSNTLDIYINNMDNILNNAVNDLDSILTNIDDFSGLVSSDESTRYFSSKKIFDVLSNRMNSNNYSDALVVFNRDSDVFIAAYDPKIKLTEKDDIMYLVKEDRLNVGKKSGWSIARGKERVYFYKVYSIKATIVVSIVTPPSLMALVETTTANSEIFLLTDKNGNIISNPEGSGRFDIEQAIPISRTPENNYKNKYILITKRLNEINARLSVIIKKTNVLLGLSSIQWIIIILGFISFIIMPFFIIFLNKEIIKPINRLIAGIRKINQGDLDHQVEKDNYSVEFSTLTTTFNKMVREIKDLKINYYEEQLELQKAEIMYLQMQLRPHFYLNALTTIHSLSYKGENELIRKYISSLSRHLRYILKGAMTQVSLKDELNHVKNYITMQEIRFPGSVFYMVDADRELYNIKIPLMLILTFVENAFKHAMTLDDTLSILIKVEKYQIEQHEEALKIIIEDSGEGFSKETIDGINTDSSSHPQGEKIGILNIKRTLQLLYQRENLLEIANGDLNGARIEIIIPLGV